MNYRELFQAYDGLVGIGNLRGLTLNLAIVKNKNKMAELIKEVEESYKVTDSYKEFEEKRVEICIKHATKDKEGNPEISEAREYVFTDEERTKFDRAIKKLSKEYQEDIDFRQNQLKELAELEEKGVDFSYITIREKDLPREISTEQLDALYFMIK